MRSVGVLDRCASVADVPEVQDLLVLWQHPQTREIIPIGRFAYDGDTYSFTYTRAAAAIEDFRPLPGLDVLRRSYVSNRIPSVFGQRVMEADRPDYAEYLHTLGLDPAHATPWEQIVHSGGTRAGDTLQFMQVPTVNDGRARARFLVNGVRHIPDTGRTVGGRTVNVAPEQHEAALRGLVGGDTVSVDTEEDNHYDACASLIITKGVPVGWVPRALSASIRELMASGPVTATVVRIGEPGTPPHLRLVLDLDVATPFGFQFDRDGLWEPLPAQ
jgi:hypothetical protein